MGKYGLVNNNFDINLGKTITEWISKTHAFVELIDFLVFFASSKV